MPSGLIDEKDGVGSWGDGFGDFATSTAFLSATSSRRARRFFEILDGFVVDGPN
jgi:hypothetical protein